MSSVNGGDMAWVGKRPARRLGGMADALTMAADLGFPVPDTEGAVAEGGKGKGANEEALVRVLRELSTVQRNLANLQVELQGRQDDERVAHLTHVSEIKKKSEALAKTTATLQDVIHNKDRIIARLQQPYSLDCIPVETEYQRQFSELLLKAAGDYGALTASTTDIHWTQNFKEPPSVWGAAWIRVPHLIREDLEAEGLSLREGIHAASHALLNIMPLYIMCNPQDLGCDCANPNDTRYYPERLLLFDKHPGGIGIAAQVRPMFAELLQSALELLVACECTANTGCPACIQVYSCSEYNEVVNKRAAILILQMLSQSMYIVRLLCVEHVEKNDKPMLYLVFEYMDTDLQKYIDSHGRGPSGKPLPPKVVQSFMYQLCTGLAHCHGHGVMHRDLKPQNLLVDKQTRRLKIADLGLGRAFTVPMKSYTHEIVTLWYRAPEVLLGATHYSLPVDIWSVGCIFAELIRKMPLFTGDSELQQLLHIFRLLGTPNETTWPGVGQHRDWHEFPQWKPQDLSLAVPGLGAVGLDLLAKMLAYEPSKRISAKAALSHHYFDDLDKTAT